MTSSSTTDPVILLHGDLDLHIHSARNLPNMDILSDHLRRCFTSCPRPNRSHSRHHHRHVITSDAYVTVSIASAVVARTRVIPNSQNPNFDESFIVLLAHSDSHLVFNVKDNDLFGADVIGIAKIPTSLFLSSPVDHQWFPILSNSGKPPKPDCAILVSLKFTPCLENPIYGHLSGGVPNCYFPVRNGGMVRLYQDAHVREGDLGEIEMEEGKIFERGRCWEDICHGILEAHHLIYVIGWSIYHKVRLVRETTRPLPDNVAEMSLGELLKYKSQEGVRVCLLVWDDKTSHDRMFLKTV